MDSALCSNIVDTMVVSKQCGVWRGTIDPNNSSKHGTSRQSVVAQICITLHCWKGRLFSFSSFLLFVCFVLCLFFLPLLL